MGWDTSQYATYNIPVGSSLGACFGMYNTYWISNTGWTGGGANHSMGCWLRTYFTNGTLANAPRVYNMNGKGSCSQSNLTTAYLRYEDRRFYFSVNCQNGKGIIETVSPLPQSGTTVAGYNNNSLSNDQTYINISAKQTYPYVFSAWRYNNVSGTLWNTVSNTNVYHNSSNIMNGAVQQFWAQFL